MLSTIELEKYIKKEISDRLGKVNWREINFKEGNEIVLKEHIFLFKIENITFYIRKKEK